jgi:hypothetical protein
MVLFCAQHASLLVISRGVACAPRQAPAFVFGDRSALKRTSTNQPSQTHSRKASNPSTHPIFNLEFIY